MVAAERSSSRVDGARSISEGVRKSGVDAAENQLATAIDVTPIHAIRLMFIGGIAGW